MKTSETVEVVAIIEKLSPGSNDFTNYLKHKRKEMFVEDLIVQLRIKEDNWKMKKDGVGATNETMGRANLIEFKRDSKKGKQTTRYKHKLRANYGNSKKEKFSWKCFNCSKVRHTSSECRLPKKDNTIKTNIVETINNDVSEIDLYAMVSVANMIDSKPVKW